MILKYVERKTVEFVLDLDAVEIPHLMGSWDGWRLPGVPMVRQQGEAPVEGRGAALSGRTSVPVPDRQPLFNDTSADRYVDNGLGGDNAVVIVEEPPKKAEHRSSPKRAAMKRRSQ
jgi:hypothetical protein